jgi:acetyl esterase/lipase
LLSRGVASCATGIDSDHCSFSSSCRRCCFLFSARKINSPKRAFCELEIKRPTLGVLSQVMRGMSSSESSSGNNNSEPTSHSGRQTQHQTPSVQRVAPQEQPNQEQEQKHYNTTNDTASSSIEISTRSDISLLYRVVRTLIRPLRPNLVRPGKPLPPGSPQLSAPKKQGVEIVESCYEDVWQYTFCPKSTGGSESASTSASASSSTASTPASASTATSSTSTSDSSSSPTSKHGNHTTTGKHGQPKHRIYYFNGGGFQSPPSSQHWLFLATLSKNLSRRSSSNSHSHSHQPQNKLVPEITLISYPLAPNTPAEKSFPILQKWLAEVLHSADVNRDKVTLMGDSSGGNIALSLGFWAVENHIPRRNEQPDPTGRGQAIPAGDRRSGFPLASVIAISPAVDLRNVNDDMHEADRYDPVLTIALTSRVARAWASNPSRHLSEVPDGPRPHLVTDAQLSPLLNTDAAFEALAKKGVAVHGIVGTHDVLAPDALLFMRKCERCGVSGKWLVWERQMHCFPLAAGKGPLGLREAKDGMNWIEEVIRNHEF